MSSKYTVKLAVILICATIAGCKEKGKDFEGRWNSANSTVNSSLVIVKSDGVFHIDHLYKDTWLNKDKVNKMEAVAISDDVLEIRTALGSVNIRKNGDRISFENKDYVKQQ